MSITHSNTAEEFDQQITRGFLNPLSNNKILDLPKFKMIADGKSNVTQIMKLAFN